MGCNLCTFQKREEHYKLLYEVSQVSAGSLIPKQLNSQPGFVFVWKMVNELWLALCFLSVDFRMEGRLAGGGLFILVLGGSFQLPCHSPFRWLPVGFFLTFFFCIYCQDVSQVKGVTLRSMSVIFWDTFHFGIVLTFEKSNVSLSA